MKFYRHVSEFFKTPDNDQDSWISLQFNWKHHHVIVTSYRQINGQTFISVIITFNVPTGCSLRTLLTI